MPATSGPVRAPTDMPYRSASRCAVFSRSSMACISVRAARQCSLSRRSRRAASAKSNRASPKPLSWNCFRQGAGKHRNGTPPRCFCGVPQVVRPHRVIVQFAVGQLRDRSTIGSAPKSARISSITPLGSWVIGHEDGLIGCASRHNPLAGLAGYCGNEVEVRVIVQDS